ncbi:MAG: hypothetical protein P1P84_14705 [Deferrisomatales bacterium]|nr:hypothetical protein [Deferrisomatales bacterium]
MLSPVRLLVWVLVAVGLAFAAVAQTEGKAGAAQPVGSPVPVSLDALYPPATAQPVYLFHMLSLDESFTGIVADWLEGDLPGVEENYEDFKTRYSEIRTLVPEWESYYPTEPVAKLGAAVASGDPERLMAAFRAVGQTCHRCHQSTMVPVQQRYHWGDFGALTLVDPLSREMVDFSRFKQSLSTNLTGIRVDLRQGQLENALRHFEAFAARFESLKESCGSCHDRETLAFIDGEVQGAVEELGRVLRGPRPSPETVATLIQGVGAENCSKCHRVHVPAAIARATTR